MTDSLPVGRGEGFIIPEVLELLRRGHDVLVIPINPRGKLYHADAHEFESRVEGLLSKNVVTSAMSAVARRTRKSMNVLRLLLKANKWIQRIKNIAIFPKGLWLALVAEEWRADLIHVHWASAPASAGLIAASLTGLPWGITAHRFDIEDDNLLAKKAERAQFIRAISRSGRDKIVQITDGRHRPDVIHMGVVIPPPVVRTVPGGSPFRILMASNFKVVKGHRYIIDALSRLRASGRRIELDLAGGGALLGGVRRQIETQRLEDCVRILGVVSHKTLIRRIAAGEWHAMVLPSITTDDGDAEGIPVALMEAMASCIPVISTNTGSIPELLHGGAGIMVPERDSGSLASAIAQLMDDHDTYRELSMEGYNRVSTEFNIDCVASRLVSLFERYGAINGYATEYEDQI